MTARGLRVEVAEKLVPPRFKWTDINRDLLPAGDDLLAPELCAFELLGCRIVVLDNQRNLLTGRDLDFRWLEPVILDDEGVGCFLRREVGFSSQNQDERKHRVAHHEGFFQEANATYSHL